MFTDTAEKGDVREKSLNQKTCHTMQLPFTVHKHMGNHDQLSLFSLSTLASPFLSRQTSSDQLDICSSEPLEDVSCGFL